MGNCFVVVVLFPSYLKVEDKRKGEDLYPLSISSNIHLLRIYMLGICCVQDTETILRESLNEEKFYGNRILKVG